MDGAQRVAVMGNTLSVTAALAEDSDAVKSAISAAGIWVHRPGIRPKALKRYNDSCQRM